MTIRYDAATGTLEVDKEDFARIVASVAQAESVQDPGSDPRVHPKIGVGLRTVVSPVCDVTVCVATADGIVTHRGWVSEEAAAFLLETSTELDRFAVVDPEFLPGVLSQLTHLGPRKVRDERDATDIPVSVAEDLFNEDAAARQEAFAALPTPGVKRALRVECRWTGPDGGPAGRGVAAVDGSEGVWILEPGSEAARLLPGSATVIWRGYCSLLPEESELGEAAEQAPPAPADA